MTGLVPHRGDERLSGSDRASDSGEQKNKAKKSPVGRPSDVGRALRSAYDDTLREDIPADLKDLLGRLD